MVKFEPVEYKPVDEYLEKLARILRKACEKYARAWLKNQKTLDRTLSEDEVDWIIKQIFR